MSKSKWPFWQSFVVPALWRWSNFHAPTWSMGFSRKGDGWENSIHVTIWAMKSTSPGKALLCSHQPFQRYISKWNKLREQAKTLDGPNLGYISKWNQLYKETKSLDGPSPGWLWRKITMAVMKWKGKGVEVTSALQSTRIGIYWVEKLINILCGTGPSCCQGGWC